MDEVRIFQFPMAETPDAVSSSFWGQALQGKGPEEVRLALKTIWSEPVHPEVQLLREKLLGFIPYGLSCSGEKVYLRLDHPDLSRGVEGIGDCYYFLEPGTKSEMAGVLSRFGIGATHDLSEFFSLFRGLSESIETEGGFELPSGWRTFGEVIGPWKECLDDLAAIEAWEGSVKIYHALNSDLVLLNQAGGTAWFRYGNQSIQPIASRFEDFLNYFRRHMDCHWPFDSHGK